MFARKAHTVDVLTHSHIVTIFSAEEAYGFHIPTIKTYHSVRRLHLEKTRESARAMRPLNVVVVDDEPHITSFARAVFEAEGHVCEVFHNSQDATAFLSSHPADLALIDIYLGVSDGLDLARSLRLKLPGLYIVVMTAHISLETAARSAAEGAIEYLGKPVTTEQLVALCARVDNYRSHAHIPAPPIADAMSQSAMIGRSPRMLEVYNAISRVAPSNANVLILGASGTGKELVARALHRYSKRSAHPFIPVNCGSFTETILESELFGHEKGSFTGAQSAHKGLLESACGGTIFLDEVTETTLAFQVKLLRAIQEQQVRRVGSNGNTPIDVRVLAASNRDAMEMIRGGTFREDLYYRLSVVQIILPDLRDRREDIPLLAEHFLRQFNATNGSSVVLEASAVERLQSMAWPGNVRELENTVQRLAIFATTRRITVEDVDRESKRTSRNHITSSAETPMPDRLLEMERRQIARVLTECGGNKAEAARRLGIERKTLYKKALRLGISLHPEEER